ncbi:hypothetical protein MXB_2346 [Myxobolus squamalis]|nr:hypothetical protein MXB_2346 [Myxobolus squamalis]
MYTQMMALFAAGNLLGQIFFKILPESAELANQENLSLTSATVATLLGYFAMYFLEICSKAHGEKENKMEGYLNLFANILDNFSHGIALTTGYSLSVKTGIFTTMCLILHEIPHEISDIFILIHSGFNRREAIIGQATTCIFCTVGSIFTLIYSSMASFLMIMLGLVNGSFLYISLTSIMGETNKNIKKKYLKSNNWLRSGYTDVFSVAIGLVTAYIFN